MVCLHADDRQCVSAYWLMAIIPDPKMISYVSGNLILNNLTPET